ncbi:MAG: serine/threonine protein kinase, partial [Phycisphaerae bacterium]|nr:serine/threonine protein kinase [Phycisphaerae bacterium]
LMIDAPRGLGVQKAAYFLREIGRGLAYLHDHGIVHRDMKPGNIFYEDGYVKIGDYGLSKAISPSHHSGQTMSVGTVHYMAPEVGSGNYSKTIDVYALGVMLYEMLLGRVPYQGATMGEVLMKHLTAQPEVDELPAPFPEVIRKALAKDPSDRFASVQDMVNAVFATQDLERSVATFEPASITQAAAAAARRVNATVAVGAGGGFAAAGPLGTGSSNIGGWQPGDAGLHPDRADRIAVSPPHRVVSSNDEAQAAAGAADRKSVRRKIIEKGLPAALIALAVSVVASLVSFRGQYVGIVTVPVIFGFVASIVGGVILGTWYSFHRNGHVSFWMHRFVNAGCVGGCMGALLVLLTPVWLAMSAFDRPDGGLDLPPPAPIVGQVTMESRSDGTSAVQRTERTTLDKRMGRDRATAPPSAPTIPFLPQLSRRAAPLGGAMPNPWPWTGPLLLVVLLGDWSGRVYRGRQGRVTPWMAFTAGLFAFVAAKVLQLDREAFAIGVVAAAGSLTLEIVSSLWPMRPGERVPSTDREGRYRRRRDQSPVAAEAAPAEGAYDRAAAATPIDSFETDVRVRV